MKRFRVVRDEDVSGISGTGYVAEGCRFRNGKCTVVWRSEHSSVNTYDSIEDIIAVHGHGGRTKIEWIDPIDDPELETIIPPAMSHFEETATKMQKLAKDKNELIFWNPDLILTDDEF